MDPSDHAYSRLIALVGEGGSGKSPLMRTLAGLYYASEIILIVDGGTTAELTDRQPAFRASLEKAAARASMPDQTLKTESTWSGPRPEKLV